MAIKAPSSKKQKIRRDDGHLDILIEEFEGSLWVAALQNGRLEGFEVDPIQEEVRWGSIYWAKVKSIDASLDAAFLDLDGFNTGLLYNKDVRIKNADGTFEKGGAKAIGKVLPPGKIIAVQAKSAYMPLDYDDYAKMESKNPEMSMDITLPGRYMIFCPMVNENRLSQRIRDQALRKQIHKMMDEMAAIKGCILRSSAANTQTDILIREAKILNAAWEQMSGAFEGDEPGLVMIGPDAIQRTLSDHAAHLIDRIEVVTMDHYSSAEEWCSIFAPDLVTKIEPIELPDATEDLALFHYRDIIGQIEDLGQPYMLMPGGGNLIIQDTAALTAIDINKGGDKRSNLAINVEAAHETARQMRLRNTGGIILIDFLKFQSKKDEEEVMKALENAIALDPCTVQIHGKTALGLVEITRKRRTPALHDRMKGIEFE
jgi:Rne/Rng family ribonuclease